MHSHNTYTGAKRREKTLCLSQKEKCLFCVPIGHWKEGAPKAKREMENKSCRRKKRLKYASRMVHQLRVATNTHTHTHTHVHTHTYTYTYIHAYTHTYIHTHINRQTKKDESH